MSTMSLKHTLCALLALAGLAPHAAMAGEHDAHQGHNAAPAPEQRRSPDPAPASAAQPHADMADMDMDDNVTLGMLRVDQLEQVSGRQGDGQRWEAQAWYGNDHHRLWLRSEGQREDGRIHEGDIEALWYRPLSAFWGTQLGLRRDLNSDGPQRTWAALGVQGLAPYWFEVDATLYAGPQGRSAARLRSSYDLLLTQRLILQPEAEANAFGRADPGNGIGAGLADARLGLRLRYEIRREFAPYLGVVWSRRFGETADLAQAAGQSVSDTQFVTGLRFWF